MLPLPSSPDFPAALQTRRKSLGMSRSELARKAKIHGVMPRRYEDPTCAEFARPREDTWIALNEALGYSCRAEQLKHDSSASTETNVKPLSIAEAKAGLALTFGVDLDRIEIVIRG